MRGVMAAAMRSGSIRASSRRTSTRTGVRRRGDAQRGGDEGERGEDDLIPGADAHGPEDQVQAASVPARHADAVFGAGEGGERLLEVVERRAQDETGVFDDAVDRRVDLGAMAAYCAFRSTRGIFMILGNLLGLSAVAIGDGGTGVGRVTRRPWWVGRYRPGPLGAPARLLAHRPVHGL